MADYGSETRQVVTNFQMHAGIVADGIAGAQMEPKLLSEPIPAPRRPVALLRVWLVLALAGTWAIDLYESPESVAVF
jgi:peptidoglycan hydrolase-like protein with peptidoglycan-binding domain